MALSVGQLQLHLAIPPPRLMKKPMKQEGKKKKKKESCWGMRRWVVSLLVILFFFRGVSRYVTDSSTVLGLERLTIHSCCHKHRETLALSREKRFLPFNFSFFFLFFFLSLARNELNGVGGCRAYSIPADDSGGMVW